MVNMNNATQKHSSDFLIEVAILNGYIERAPEGKIRPAQPGIDLVMEMVNDTSNPQYAALAAIDIKSTVEMLSLICLMMEALLNIEEDTMSEQRTTVVNINESGVRQRLKSDPNYVYIGRSARGLKASKWLNKYKIGRDGTRADVIAKYRDNILSRPTLLAALPELRGKTLVCWCAPNLCHGNVLAELADAE